MSAAANFALTADQRMVQDSAAQFLTQVSSSAAVRQAMVSDDGIDREVWRRIGSELGWCATAVPEQNGGLGLGPLELVLLMEQMGRRLACVPFFSTVCLAAGALIECAHTETGERYLTQIAEGTLSASLPLGVGASDWRSQRDAASAVLDGGQYVLNGSFKHVPDGASAELLLLPAWLQAEEKFGLFAVPHSAAGVTRTARTTIDATRRLAEVQLNQVRLAPEMLLAAGETVIAGLDRTAALAMIYLAAEQLGGAQQCLDMTVDYVSQRVQFGRTIASFQAIKHRCAEMMVKLEATRSAVYGAAYTVANTADLSALQLLQEAACARVFATDTFFFCAQEAIQLHGGVGFTWEYDPHLYFKRAQASSHWLGHPDLLREQVAASLLD